MQGRQQILPVAFHCDLLGDPLAIDDHIFVFALQEIQNGFAPVLADGRLNA